MADDPDGIILGRGVRAQPQDDPDGIILGAPVAIAAGGVDPGRRAGRSRETPRSGRFIGWLVGAASSPALPEPGDAGGSADPQAHTVVGVGECCWEFRQASEETQELHARLSPAGAGGGRSRATAPWGYIVYTFSRLWCLQVPCLLPPDVDVADALTPMDLFNRLKNEPVQGDGGTVESVLGHLRDIDLSLLVEDMPLVEGIVDDPAPRIQRSVQLGLRSGYAGLVSWHPRRSYITRWRADHGVARAASARHTRKRSWEDIYFAIPEHAVGPDARRRKMRKVNKGDAKVEKDPLKLLSALWFGKFLKQQAEFSAALGAAAAYENSDIEPEDRDAADDPCEYSLREAWSRMDVVDMLLWRREFEADYELDRLFAVNLLTDSSPVSGSELQGLIMDIERRNGEKKRITLPGTSLAYGLFDGVNKTVGLLHAIWLVSGPRECVIRYVCSRVASITTDMGIEVMTLTMPDFVTAYCKFMGGMDLPECAAYVRRDVRLFPNAVRVGGWGHGHGNVMKHCAEKESRWPEILTKMRALVRFWQVATYREHVGKMLIRYRPGQVNPKLLRSFTASFAKWRYEAIAHAMWCLNKLRFVCEVCMLRIWFNHVQDQEEMNRVFDACADAFLWRFMAVAEREVFGKCEGQRRWGMVCPCHQKERHEGQKNIDCWYNSRRLHQAWEFTWLRIQEHTARSATITEAECEGDTTLFASMKHLLLQMASLLEDSFKYMDEAPWCLARCESPEGCQHFLKKVAAHPMAEHDPLTRKIVVEVGDAIQTRADGGELSRPLQDWVRFIKTAVLDEGAGEGYHRGSNKEILRATASKEQHLKQQVRRPGALAHVRSWKRLYGARGMAVIRFEWRMWKHILKSEGKHSWRPGQERRTAAFSRIYREDPSAARDWTMVVVPEDKARPVRTESSTALSSLHHEYLKAKVRVGQRYSMPTDAPQPAAAEAAEPAAPAAAEPAAAASSSDAIVVAPAGRQPSRLYFQLLQVSHGHSRAHLMPSVASADDISLIAHLAFRIQTFTPWVPAAVGVPQPAGTIEVYPDNNPAWVRPEQLGSFVRFSDELCVYEATQEGSQAGCDKWSNMSLERIRFDVLDDRCPTYAIMSHLKRKGWKVKGTPGRAVHTTAAITDFDCQEAIKFKAYYQVLAKIPACMPLTTSIPSRECIGFYRLLLRGIKTEPGLAAKTYQLAINADRKARGKVIEPLPLEDAPLGPQDPDGIIIPRPAPKPEPKPLPLPSGPHTGAAAKRGKGKAKGRGRGGDEVVCPPAVPPGPIEAVPPIGPMPPVPPAPPEPGAGGAALADPDGIIAVRPEPKAIAVKRKKEDRVFVDCLDGCRATYKDYIDKHTGKHYPNIIMRCPHCPPGACEKTKGMTPGNSKRHGAVEALLYLHTWADIPPAPGKTHRNTSPTREQVDAYAVDHKEAMRPVLERLLAT